jgi:hypothetical protein
MPCYASCNICFSPVSVSFWWQEMLIQVRYILLDYSFQFSPHLQICYTQTRFELLNLFYDLLSSVFQYVLPLTTKNKFGACFEHRLAQSSQSASIITSLYGKLNLQRKWLTPYWNRICYKRINTVQQCCRLS